MRRGGGFGWRSGPRPGPAPAPCSTPVRAVRCGPRSLKVPACSSRTCFRRCVRKIQPPRRAHRGGHPEHLSTRLLRRDTTSSPSCFPVTGGERNERYKRHQEEPHDLMVQQPAGAGQIRTYRTLPREAANGTCIQGSWWTSPARRPPHRLTTPPRTTALHLLLEQSHGQTREAFRPVVLVQSAQYPCLACRDRIQRIRLVARNHQPDPALVLQAPGRLQAIDRKQLVVVGSRGGQEYFPASSRRAEGSNEPPGRASRPDPPCFVEDRVPGVVRLCMMTSAAPT